MEEKINRKPLIITIIVAIFMIIVIAIQMKISKKIKIKNENDITETIKMFNMDEHSDIIIKKVVEKNSNWSKLPLSDNFKSKYNSKDGILANDNFDSLDSCTILSSNEEQIVVLNIGHGYRYDNYYFHYDLNDKNELDDVQLIKTEVTQYAEGLTPTIASEPSYINKNNYKNAITHLSTPYMYEFDGVETTENFKEKYGNGFGDESEFIDINGIIAIEKLSNWDDKVVYFYKRGTHIDGTEDYERFYICNFTLDDEGRVDDIKIVDISEAEIDKLLGIK